MEEVERLCAVLGDEARVCGELAGVLREEQRAMVGLRPQAIFACLEQRHMLQEELLVLSARRQTLLRDAATQHGASRPAAAALLPLLPPEPQARLRTQLRTLRSALLEARGLERQNALLARASLKNVDDLLRTLRALVPGARYDAGAQVATPPPVEQVDRRV